VKDRKRGATEPLTVEGAFRQWWEVVGNKLAEQDLGPFSPEEEFRDRLAGALSAARTSGLADVPGRWMLRKATAGPCVLGFSGAPDIPHGTIAAMGFCPQIFFGLPRWRLDAGYVVIRNRHGRTLVELAVGRGRLDGQTATGEAILLVR